MPRRRCERRTISFITSARCRPFARGSRPSWTEPTRRSRSNAATSARRPSRRPRGHTLPVRCGLGPLERQDEADRGAALDRVDQQLDQLILPPRGLVGVERPNGDQLAGAVQVGRPSIG